MVRCRPAAKTLVLAMFYRIRVNKKARR